MGDDHGRRIAPCISWRAGCGGSRTSGSGDGPGKRASRNAGHRAPARSHWATDALDVVRRSTWNDARKKGMTAEARQLKGARFALWRNPEDLTTRQQAKLSWIKTANGPLYRAYLLKEQLRQILHVKHERAIEMLQAWCQWASRSQLTAFVDLARRIRKNEPGILNALLNRLSNGLVESTNTKIRVLTRIAYGFTNTDHLIALALLDRGGHCPPTPRP